MITNPKLYVWMCLAYWAEQERMEAERQRQAQVESELHAPVERES